MELESDFFDGRKRPWDIGSDLKGISSVKDAMKKADLDWEVELSPLFTEFNGENLELDDKVAVRRMTDGSVLGVVSPKYHVVNMADCFDWLDVLTADDKIVLYSADYLKGGKIVWISARIPGAVQIGTELIELYLTVSNSYDGTLAFGCSVTPMRVRGMTTLRLPLRAHREWKAKHRRGAIERVDIAANTMAKVYSYMEEFRQLTQKLASVEFMRSDFDAMLNTLIPLPKDADPESRAFVSKEQTRDTMMGLFLNSPNLEGYRETAWGAINAIAEYSDWARRTNLSKDLSEKENERKMAEARFIKQLNETELKDSAYDFIVKRTGIK